MMFEAFMSVGQVHDGWRSAVVTLLFKKDLPTRCGNYRPVSLTSVICKTMEKIILSQMIEYLRKYNIISKQQHGFFSRHSTVTHLLEAINDWTVALQNNNGISVVYIGYSKAFDTVTPEAASEIGCIWYQWKPVQLGSRFSWEQETSY